MRKDEESRVNRRATNGRTVLEEELGASVRAGVPFSSEELDAMAGAARRHWAGKLFAGINDERFSNRRFKVIRYLAYRLRLKKKVTTMAKFIILPALAIVGFTALRIYTYGNRIVDVKADAAIVLGAAVWGKEVSPVFRERINHAIDLYRSGKVRKLIFTGGQGNRRELTEAAAARAYAIKNGVPADDILIEDRSHTTYENVINAKQLADANGLRKVLIVSDPLHMKRAVTMARDVGLDAYPSPTPTTRYQGWRSQIESLAHETYYYTGYWAWKVFNYELPVSE